MLTSPLCRRFCALGRVSVLSAFTLLGACAAQPDSPPSDAIDAGVTLAQVSSAFAPSAPGCHGLPNYCCQKTTMGGHDVWVHFNDPPSGCSIPREGSEDRVVFPLRDEIIRLIAAAPTDSFIRGNVFSVSDPDFVNALKDAQDRGVHVLLTADSAVLTEPGLPGIRDVHYCAQGRGCIANAVDSKGNPKGGAHSKVFTFSSTVAPSDVPPGENPTYVENVVWISSSNMKRDFRYEDGKGGFNNSVTIYGDPANPGDTTLYDGMVAYLNDLRTWDDRYLTPPIVRPTDYYQPNGNASEGGRVTGYIASRAADVYISPEPVSDLVADRLDDIDITYPIAYPTGKTGPDRSRYAAGECEVVVAMAWVQADRDRVLTRLIKMHKAGCAVSVVAMTDNLDLCAVRDLLAPMNNPSGITPISVMANPLVHDKVILAHGVVPTTVSGQVVNYDKYRVFTGSHNIKTGANTDNDEVFVKMATEWQNSKPLYDAFKAHFGRATSTASSFAYADVAMLCPLQQVTLKATGSSAAGGNLSLSDSRGNPVTTVIPTAAGKTTTSIGYSPYLTMIATAAKGKFSSCPGTVAPIRLSNLADGQTCKFRMQSAPAAGTTRPPLSVSATF